MQITLRNGTKVLIDDDRADLATLRGWFMHSSGYVGREYWSEGKRSFRFLHEVVYGEKAPPGHRIDHENRNVLDCRRLNLRLVTASQNAQNREKTTKRGLPRGVFWKTSRGKWAAQATVNYRKHHIGYFDSVEAADKAVSAWRREHMTHSEVDKAVL